MPTLVIGNLAAIQDEAAIAQYRAEALRTVEAYGGRFAIRGGDIDVLEGNWQPEHLSILEFPSAAQARRWYESPEYQALVDLRRDAHLDLVIVDGG
jgi:uncharacterized protein (DUF1330 family)